MRSLVLVAALGCRGNPIPQCVLGRPATVELDQMTSVGSVRALLASLDGAPVRIEDGQTGSVFVEQLDEAWFTDHFPNRAGRAGYMEIGPNCNDTLTVPVRYELQLTEESRTADGEITHTAWNTEVKGPLMRLRRDVDEDELWGRLDYPPVPLF